ncbi:MAG TPA: methylated-DNA--[protein]-cysteine S-methyltransferase [Burkholderiales bacterium]
MRYSATYKSPLGDMLVISTAEALVGLHFMGQKYFPRVDAAWEKNTSIAPIRETIRQLDEFFAGARDRFDVPLGPYGTSYQHAIWNAISTVPYGETITYGELARRAGHPKDARAAGAATGQNPIGIIVPCHRIIGANGKLTGYAGGLDKKRALLALEAEHTRTMDAGSSGVRIQGTLV